MPRLLPWKWIVAGQAVVLGSFGLAFALASPDTVARFELDSGVVQSAATPDIPRTTPLVIEPLYDRPDFVSDDALAAVLRQVQPRFPRKELKPNFVEHALRIWGVSIDFHDPEVLDGPELEGFLTDHARYAMSWGEAAAPLLEMHPDGVVIRYGLETGASVHHDHWLASLTEAGVHLDTPVYGPGRHNAAIADVLRESLRDFRLDERETEWTAMAFGLWLAPQREWTGADGRRFSFDLLAARLLRGEQHIGVCSGTHRLYSLTVLLRLDDDYDILSDATRTEVLTHLARVRDEISASQQPDGHWPSNWADGAAAVEQPIEEELYKQVIATGHHLEWLALAPRELHPLDEHLRKAAQWAIDTTAAQTPEQILERYTFFSHVGNALALWRGTHPADFWEQRPASDEEVVSSPDTPSAE